MIDTIQLRMVFELLIAVTIWPFLLGVYLIVGSRQWLEVQGTATRLFWVSVVAATLASLPMLIWLIVLLPPYSVETSWWFALGLTAVSAGGVGRMLRSPLPKVSGDLRMSKVGDERLLKQIRDASQTMGMLPPAVIRLESENNQFESAVCVGRLTAPTLILLGNFPKETHGHDPMLAIANALGVFASGELWWKAALRPMAAVAASLASAFVSIPLAIGIGLVFYFIVRRIVLQWCAARARGFAARVGGSSGSTV